MLLTERYKLTMPSKSIITSENCHILSLLKSQTVLKAFLIQTSTKHHIDVEEKLQCLTVKYIFVFSPIYSYTL